MGCQLTVRRFDELHLLGGVMSKFLDILMLRHCIGSIVKMNGRYLSLPLDRWRPPEPFEALFSDRALKDETHERIMGEVRRWRPRSAGRLSDSSVLRRIG